MMRLLAVTLVFASLVTSPLVAAPELTVSSTANASVLRNGRMEIWFPKSDGVFKEAHFFVKTTEGRRLMAVAKPFYHLSYEDSAGEEQNVDLCAATVRKRFLEDGRVGLEFRRDYTDIDGAEWTMETLITLRQNDDFASVESGVSASERRRLVCFRPMTVLAGEGSYGTAKDEALFPGLEYLLKGESSSSKLDVTAKERRRFAPHPYKITIPLMDVYYDGYHIALLWDANQKWDGKMECPSALFASPNFLQNGKNHLMALYLPSFPWVEEYKTRASTPYPLQASKELRLSFEILLRPGKHAIDAVDNWIRIHGFPNPPEKPVDWSEEANLSLAPYITQIWREDKDAFGWVPWTDMKPTASPETCSLLMLGADLTRDRVLARKLREKALYVAKKAFSAGSSNLEYAYTFGPLKPSLKMANDSAENLIKTQKSDGCWVFDPPKGRTLLGVPLTTLGDPGESAVGLVAEPASYLLRYSRITGDTKAAEAGIRALRYMNRFIRPQASQTWECPVHAPDILASARAVDAYLQGYLLTGDESLLMKARYWARTGLPFIYFWNAPDRSTMKYSTIAVYGASLYTWPWFGRPVQWNGLAYADAIRRLAPYDKTYDWRTIAKGIIIDATREQGTTGENKGLYPDSWYLIDDTPGGPWIQPAQYLLGDVLGIMGREHDVRTQVIRTNTGRVHISMAAEPDAVLDMKLKLLRIKASGGVSSLPLLVSVAGLGKPIAVHWNGVRLSEGRSGWNYSDGTLFINGKSSGSGKIQVTYDSLKFALAPVSVTPLLELHSAAVDPVAGQPCRLTVRATNPTQRTVSDLSVTPDPPDGWPADLEPGTVKSLPPRGSAVLTWKLTPPVAAAGTRSWIGITAKFSSGGKARVAEDGAVVKPAEPVTLTDAFSDIAVVDGRAVVKKLFRLRNAASQVCNGSLSLKVPEGWEIASRKGTAFSIPAKASMDIDAELRSPPDTLTGRYDASASLSIAGETLPSEPFELEVPAFCSRGNGKIRVDGDLSEWPDPLPIRIAHNADTKGGPKDEADLSGRAAAAWDDNYLYLAFSVNDDKFLQQKEGAEIWRQDSVQVAFDTFRDRNSGGYEDDDYEYGFALTPSEILCWRFFCPPDKRPGRVNIRLAIVRSGKKIYYEAALPWSELIPFEPKPGRTLGMSLLLNDDDGDGRKILEWGGGIAEQKRPNGFMGLRLVGTELGG